MAGLTGRRLGFLNLPLEMRCSVYREIFRGSYIKVSFDEDSWKFDLSNCQPAVLNTCKQTRGEANPLLRMVGTQLFVNSEGQYAPSGVGTEPFWSRIPRHVLNNIKNVHILIDDILCPGFHPLPVSLPLPQLRGISLCMDFHFENAKLTLELPELYVDDSLYYKTVTTPALLLKHTKSFVQLMYQSITGHGNIPVDFFSIWPVWSVEKGVYHKYGVVLNSGESWAAEAIDWEQSDDLEFKREMLFGTGILFGGSRYGQSG